jgi:DNA-directed RNA polymerase subunit RPC12/RpoP
MAEAISITCPECGKKINVSSEAVGKRIRCKGCEHVFVVQAPAGKKAAKPAGKAAPAKAPPAAKSANAKKKAPDPPAGPSMPDRPTIDDDEDANPYGVTALDTAPRCPDCANEMESADAIVCLHCGYNSRTRMKIEPRAVYDVTGGTWFLWLLPGILCALGFCILLTFDVLYTFSLRFIWFGDADISENWTAIFAHPGFVIWGVWGPSVLVMVGLLAFAVRRLIFNPRPPERVKKKPKKTEDD